LKMKGGGVFAEDTFFSEQFYETMGLATTQRRFLWLRKRRHPKNKVAFDAFIVRLWPSSGR